ncbi:MAG: hypothetical protein CL940_05150, partial [Deltaproteobacteria bacterium]|nr:hypothetical protein [Deltaproteobacteria bacterium]
NANAMLASAGLSIVWDGEVEEEDNPDGSDFYNIQTTEAISALLGTNPDQEAIDLYLAHTAEFQHQGQTVSIRGYAPLGGTRVLLVANNAKVLAHELGHAFSLKHTHAVDADDACDNGGEKAGDRCCDTTFDPGPPPRGPGDRTAGGLLL